MSLVGPWGCPGASREPPGSLPGTSQEQVGTIFDTRRRFTKNVRRPGHVPERIWGPSWAQLGFQNRPKIDPWPQKEPQEPNFYRFFSWAGFLSLPGLIFHYFLLKIQSKHQRMFSKLRAFFSIRRLSKSMHRRSVLSNFYVFRVF